MNIQEARDLNLSVAKEAMSLIFDDVRRAASGGALKIDVRLQEDLDDLYDYIIIPELEKMGYNVDTFNSSSSDLNGGAMYRTLRICWHPKP